MKILIAKPPIWQEANKLFKLEELNLGTIFTYGDTLYNPFNVQLTDDLIAHEECHARQQHHSDDGARIWWRAYIDHPEFRVEQELQAYGAQYKCLCGTIIDPNRRARQLNELAKILAGPMYGGIISHTGALTKIKKSSRIKIS